jgi:hypothetical protein
MKKFLAVSGLLAIYLVFCGYTLSSTVVKSMSDKIYIISLDVKKAGNKVSPNLDKNFDRMVFYKIVSYNDPNPKNATECTVEVRVPAMYDAQFNKALTKNYTNCTITKVESIPVPTPTALAQQGI